MTEDEIRDLFREMRGTPVPADSLARVRSMLDERIRRRTRWKITAWVMAAAAVLLAVLLVRPEPAPAPRAPASATIVAREPEAPPVELSQPAPPPAVRPAKRRVYRPRHDPKSVLIRIETPDPDVVILLVGQ